MWQHLQDTWLNVAELLYSAPKTAMNFQIGRDKVPTNINRLSTHNLVNQHMASHGPTVGDLVAAVAVMKTKVATLM
jgi:hypothetical protein